MHCAAMSFVRHGRARNGLARELTRPVMRAGLSAAVDERSNLHSRYFRLAARFHRSHSRRLRSRPWLHRFNADNGLQSGVCVL